MNTAPSYRTLGLTRRATAEEIITAWRRLVVENHPDRADPAEFETANAQTAAVNAAYAEITRARGKALARNPVSPPSLVGAMIGLVVAEILLTLTRQIQRRHTPPFSP